jgi:hypothetical protein
MSDEAPPSHEVFISYATKDKKWADAACAVMEKRRIRCWIAPRDILPGTEWGAAIIRGIEGCKIVVVVFSAHANASPQVRREVERAISKGLTVLPFRIEDVAPAGAMEFALSSTHWLDGFTPPLERQLEALAASVETLIAGGGQSRSAVAPVMATGRPMGRLFVIAGVVAVAVSASVGGYFLNRVVGRDAPNIGTHRAETPDRPPATEPESRSKPPLDAPPDGTSHAPPAVENEPIRNSQPASAKPDDNDPAGTNVVVVGARVRVTKYTGAYTGEAAGRISAMVDAGQTGEILKAPKDGSMCHIRFGPPLSRDYWIHRDALKVE